MGFKRLDPEDFLVSADSVSQTVWSSNLVELSSFHTSSAQRVASISGDYYLAVYDQNVSNANSSVQFDIAYGDKTSGGAVYFNDAVPGKSTTSTIYGQYRSLILEDENADFTYGTSGASSTDCSGSISFGSSFSPGYFYAMSIERARYKEKLLPGTLSLTLQGATGNPITLTDNSNDVTVPTYFGTQRAYQIVRQGANPGSSDGINSGFTNSGSYGLFLPDTGLMLFNGTALDKPAGVPTAANPDIGIGLGTVRTLDADENNNSKFFQALVRGSSFKLNCEETLSSDFIFVRARNAEFNYSENPSFIQGSTGEVYWSSYINQPQTYITTVGLYNDQNDLLAVAKLSKPLLKDFTKEALVRVKLDF